MKTTIKNLKSLILVACLSVYSAATAQEEQSVANNESKLTVFGTSNVHDWEIEAKAMNGKGIFVWEGSDLKEIKGLNFIVEVEQLKSGKKAMDANTFKALNSDKYKTINFKLIKVIKISEVAGNQFTIETQGDLTISGVTKRITQIFNAKPIGKKVLLSGKNKVNMTHYSVKPPTALMGTIKTGEEVTIDFKVVYN